ncbi:MAG: aminopeptidase P family protein [Bacteroidota bacterium]
MFDPATYRTRRAHLAATLEQGLVVMPGHALSPMNYAGNAYPFWQDGSFLYYWGLNRPDLAGVLDLDQGTATLFGDELTTDDLVWTGPQPALAEEAAQAGLVSVRPSADLASVVRAALQQGRPLHLTPPYRPATRLRLATLLDLTPAEVDAHVSRPLIEAVVAQRSRKTSAEVEQIEDALSVTAAMHVAGMQLCRPGLRETDVAGRLEGEVLRHGRRLAFPLIFTTHGEVLHNHPTDRALEAGRLALCDGGATSPKHYASDITRTYPVDGRFTAPQRDLYQIVLNAQEACIRGIAPGVRFLDLHRLAARHLVEGLQQLGLMQGDADEAVAAGAHALFFPHGLGHMMGLDVHDMEGLGEDHVGYGAEMRRSDQFGLSALRLARTLEPGFVVTVEPGLYLIPGLIAQWRQAGRGAPFIRYEALEAYLDAGGIRIEDDVLVTDDGHRVLGPPIPKQPEDVEYLMQEAT